MQETRVWCLGQEDPLDKKMATHSSILARRIPWTEEPGSLQSVESQRVGYHWATNTFTCTEILELGLQHVNCRAGVRGHYSTYNTLPWEVSYTSLLIFGKNLVS